jgi:hypothetical protein
MISFGVYEVDLHAEELRKSGVKIRLRGQPFQILAMLLERPGEVVTREEFGPETIVQKPDGRFQIVGLGGSSAWDFGCTGERTVPGRLEALLPAKYAIMVCR